MRPLQHSFLFCCPLRTGGVIIAIAHMLTAGALLFINGEYLDDFDAQFLQAREAGCVEGSAAEYNLEKTLLLIDLLTQALGLAFAIFLLLGALKGKPKLVLAWSVYVLFALVLYASRTIGLYLSNGLSSLAHTRSTLALVADSKSNPFPSHKVLGGKGCTRLYSRLMRHPPLSLCPLVVTLYCAAAMLKLHQELREVQSGRSGTNSASAATASSQLNHQQSSSNAKALSASSSTNPYAAKAAAALQHPNKHFERI